MGTKFVASAKELYRLLRAKPFCEYVLMIVKKFSFSTRFIKYTYTFQPEHGFNLIYLDLDIEYVTT